MITPVEDIEFLARSDHRVNALGALAAGPPESSRLRGVVGASNATVGRLLNEFDNRTWNKRESPRYVLTPLGEFIADGFFDLVERFETERSIRDIWQWFPTDLGFTIEMFSGAKARLQDEHNPYCPNSRYAELVETSESLPRLEAISLPAQHRVYPTRLPVRLLRDFRTTGSHSRRSSGGIRDQCGLSNDAGS